MVLEEGNDNEKGKVRLEEALGTRGLSSAVNSSVDSCVELQFLVSVDLEYAGYIDTYLCDEHNDN